MGGEFPMANVTSQQVQDLWVDISSRLKSWRCAMAELD